MKKGGDTDTQTNTRHPPGKNYSRRRNLFRRRQKDKDGWRKSFTKVLDPSFLSTQVMMGGRIRTETEERNG